MSTACPKCKFIRPADSTAPDWQCPSCGVAYAKARAAAMDELPPIPRRLPEAEASNVPWNKVVMAVAFFFVGWVAYKATAPRPGIAVGSASTQVSGGGGGSGQLAALAATVQPGDVVIYSAVWCASCNVAKQWMSQNGFRYDECDVEKRAECASQFRDYGGNGIPLLIVKGQQMRAGFDTDEFIAALQAKARPG
jgi:glutaredoxin